MVQGDKEPIYEETLEDVRRFNEDPQLPFNAFGTLALARAEFDANSGSSQIFFLLKVSALSSKSGAKRQQVEPQSCPVSKSDAVLLTS